MYDKAPVNNNVLKEVDQVVVITPEDVKGAAEFWPHFEVPMPEELKVAFDKFCENPTLDNQKDLKVAVCAAVGHTDHEAFNDEMFKEIVEECRSVAYGLSFDRSLEKVFLSTPDKAE